MKRIGSLFFALILFVASIYAAEPLKVLAIGNSFSVDALEQEMYPICKAQGKELIIGNLYIGGCSIERHYNNISSNKAEYSYRKIGLDGTVDTIADCTLARAFADETWDVVTFQQASHFSGQYESFGKLPDLIAKVRAAVGPHPRFLWYQTWAYSPDSKHDAFINYGKDQQSMFRAIVVCAERALRENPQLKGIIPCGTAIQDARTSSLGTDLTRDGYHLSLDAGRYIASCTWFGVLFGESPLAIKYRPDGMPQAKAELARKAAAAAIAAPFVVTEL